MRVVTPSKVAASVRSRQTGAHEAFDIADADLAAWLDAGMRPADRATWQAARDLADRGQVTLRFPREVLDRRAQVAPRGPST